MNKLAYVLALVSLCCFSYLIVVRVLAKVTNPDASARSFTLRVEDGRGHGGSGVGWHDGTVLTAAHVIQGPLDDYTVREGDKEWSIIAARYIAGRDAVLLYVLGDGPLPVPPRRDTPIEMGEPVLAAGYPWGGPCVVTSGLISGQSRHRAWCRMSNVDVNPGNSGGPVFDEDGNLIAIVIAGTTGWGASLAVVLPITEVLDGLEQPDTGREGSLVGRGRGHRDGLYRPRHPAVP